MVERTLSTEFSSLTTSEIELFSQTPRHNQVDVLKKLEFKEFVNFKKCCEHSKEITKDFRHRLHLQIELKFSDKGFTFNFNEVDCLLEEPVRLKANKFIISEAKMSNEQFTFLKEFCQKTKIKVTEILIKGPENEPKMIDELVKLLNPVDLRTWYCSSSYLLSLEDLNRFRKVAFLYDTMEESDFLLLKNSRVHVYKSDVTLSAINNFFKQWIAGEREIERLGIVYIDCKASEIFKDLEATLLWSPETHESSPLSHLKREIEDAGTRRICTLERSDGKNLCIAFYSDTLAAKKYESIGDIEKWIQSSFTS